MASQTWTPLLIVTRFPIATWFSMKTEKDGEVRLGQGLEKARAFLLDNPDLAAALEKQVRANATATSASSSPSSGSASAGD